LEPGQSLAPIPQSLEPPASARWSSARAWLREAELVKRPRLARASASSGPSGQTGAPAARGARCRAGVGAGRALTANGILLARPGARGSLTPDPRPGSLALGELGVDAQSSSRRPANLPARAALWWGGAGCDRGREGGGRPSRWLTPTRPAAPHCLVSPLGRRRHRGPAGVISQTRF